MICRTFPAWTNHGPLMPAGLAPEDSLHPGNCRPSNSRYSRAHREDANHHTLAEGDRTVRYLS